MSGPRRPDPERISEKCSRKKAQKAQKNSRSSTCVRSVCPLKREFVLCASCAFSRLKWLRFN
jgi:hypothetical protein